MPDWSHFQVQHVLDPTNDPGFDSWNRERWNIWLQERIPNVFGSKSINSVVIARPGDILEDFRELRATHTTGPDFFWSNNRYRIYYMTLESHRDRASPYAVRDLGQMYFLAKISPNPNEPVHYHRQSTSQEPRGAVNIRTSLYPELP